MRVRNVSCLISIFAILSVPTNAQEKTYSAHDLDELMDKVWQNCKIDLDNLRGYIFNETYSLYGKEFSPSDSEVLVADRLDYVWTAKDGYLGPSLKTINGKAVPITGNKIKITKKEYSLTWDPAIVKLYVKWRQNHPKWWEKWDTILDLFDDLVEGTSGQRMYDRFDYKPRKYRYVGSLEYEGHRVIEISYPSYDADSPHGAVLVRMLVIPDENQLIAVILSVQWSKFNYVEYTMIMDNSHDNVWLPKEFRQIGTSSWGGAATVSLAFNSYAKTDVKAKFWFEDVKTKIWSGPEKREVTK